MHNWTRYTYDAKDNLVKTIEKNGDYKVYAYDSRDRVTSIDYYEKSGDSATKTLRTEFTYDDADNLTTMKDKEVVNEEEVIYRYTAYGYDEFYRLAWVSENSVDTEPSESMINANKVSYGYDIKYRLVSIDYANSNNGVNGLRFTYNTHGWLTKVDAVNNNNTEKTIREYSYADDGVIGEITDYTDFLNGTSKWLKRSYTYDKFNRVIAIDYTDNITGSSSEIKETYSYEYDKNNNIVSESKQNLYGVINGTDYSESYSYMYDAYNRLIFNGYYKMDTEDESGDSAEITYTYDAAGNRISEEILESGATSSMSFENTYTYNEFNQLTESVEESLDDYVSTEYTYDQNGNQISKTDTDLYTEIQIGQTTYTYDAANRLKTATGTTGDTVDYTQENKYNGFGQRVEKKEGTDVTNYFYDGTAVLYTTDAEDNKTSFNLIGAEDNILSTSRIGADNVADFYVYTKDVRESTTNVIGSDGLAEVSYTYDEYGKTTEYQQDENDPFYNEICYTAGAYDATTGLYNLNARYYSPAAGTFLTQDTYRGSLSRTSTLNYYAYCAGNPISYTDPSGHAAWAIAGAALGAYDGYQYAKKKNLKGWKKVAAIAGGAALGAVNPFKVVKAVKTAGKVYKASKYTKAAVSAKKTTKVVKKVKDKPKQTVVAKKSTQEAFKKATAKKTAQTVKKQSKTLTPRCFVAGTKIYTEKGFKNIEAIKVGDYVWSENPETKEKALKKVKKIFVREKDSIIRLAINGEVIETTDEHPFYVEGKGFTEAKCLKVGDEVRLATGDTAEIETIESVQLDSPVKVYNFEVEDFHTYYVSGQKVLVHNTCAKETAKNTASNYWSKAKEVAGKKVYQRDDLIDPDLVDGRGRTNLQRMEKGLAPIGPDGKSINLHHMTQTDDSAIAEVSASFHQRFSKIIHINPSSMASGIDRKNFNKWRKQYWKERVKSYQ